MKVKFMTILFATLMCSFLHAQTETRTLKSFDGLNVAGGIEVTIYKGSPKAEIEIIKGSMEDLVVEVRGGDLNIRFTNKGWGYNNSRKAKIKLYASNLADIEAAAGASVEMKYASVANKMELEASSGASIQAKVLSKNVDAEVSSGGSLNATGATDNLDLEVSSGGSFNGKKLEAKKVDVEASSGGSAKVWAANKLAAEASSGGTVRYKGDPSDTDIDVGKYSGGSVSKM